MGRKSITIIALALPIVIILLGAFFLLPSSRSPRTVVTSLEQTIQKQAVSLVQKQPAIVPSTQPSTSAHSSGITIQSAVFEIGSSPSEHPSPVKAGTPLRFSFTLSNSTKNIIRYASLVVDMDRTMLHSIGNVVGATGLNLTDTSVTVPNIVLEPNGITTLSFEGIPNYFTGQAKQLSINVTLQSDSGKTLATTDKKVLTLEPNALPGQPIANVGMTVQTGEQ